MGLGMGWNDGRRRLTIPEVAEILGISRQRVYQLIESGRLQTDGQPRRVYLSDLVAFARGSGFASRLSWYHAGGGETKKEGGWLAFPMGKGWGVCPDGYLALFIRNSFVEELLVEAAKTDNFEDGRARVAVCRFDSEQEYQEHLGSFDDKNT